VRHNKSCHKTKKQKANSKWIFNSNFQKEIAKYKSKSCSNRQGGGTTAVKGPSIDKIQKPSTGINPKNGSKISNELTAVLSIIWNAVWTCDLSCSICCVNALNICPCEYAAEEERLVSKGKQLSTADQLRVVEQIAELKGKVKIKLDVSGGNMILMMYNAWQVLKAIGEKIGRENVSISIPGTLLTNRDADFLATIASAVEVSIDVPPGIDDTTRFLNMAKIGTNALRMFKEHNVRKVVSTVIKSGINADERVLSNLAAFLSQSDCVDEWEWLRFIPVGRGAHLHSYIVKPEEMPAIFETYKNLRKKYDRQFKIRLQHSLQNIFPEASEKERRCKAAQHESLCILPDGTVVLCGWLLDHRGRPVSPEFQLGKVPFEKLSIIYKRSKRLQLQDLSNMDASQDACADCELRGTACDECMAAAQSMSLTYASDTNQEASSAKCLHSMTFGLKSGKNKGHCFGTKCSRVATCYPPIQANNEPRLHANRSSLLIAT
jgi:radical SAM protein with 4Fe4S-binding SPASM domain